jgi:hypothetical protein
MMMVLADGKHFRAGVRRRRRVAKSLDYAAAGGHAAVSVQHVIAARKDLWP